MLDIRKTLIKILEWIKQSSTNYLAIRNQGWDFTAADNGISTATYPGLKIQDKENLNGPRAEAIIKPNGNMAIQLGVRNYDTSGMAFPQQTFIMEMDKTGKTTADLLGVPMYSQSTNTITDIISPNTTNATITAASYRQWGKLAMLFITWTNNAAMSVNATGNITDLPIGTLYSGKRPATGTIGLSTTTTTLKYVIATNGNITVITGDGNGTAQTIAAGTSLTVAATYLLP